MKKKQVVVIGGGFAGLHVVRSLKRAKADITLIDRKNHHLFQPLLYQAATATLSPRDISVSFREIFAHQKNTTVIMGEVVEINKEEKFVILGNGDKFHYDYLIIAIGSQHSYFGHDEWERMAPGIKTLTDALNIREHILTAFEKAERLDSVKESEKYLSFAIVGGGPTGVEFAGTIAELIHTTMRKNFRRISVEKARIYLIEGGDRLLPAFHPSLSLRTQKDLEKLGVTVLTRSIVTNLTEDGVQIGDRFIEAHNLIWAAGNTVPKLVNTLNVEQDRQGRVVVQRDLSLANHPEIFVLGDAACYKTDDGKILPGVATVALQQGKFVGKLLLKELKTGKLQMPRNQAFKFFDKGNLATIGTGKAVGSYKNFRFTGLIAWFVWAVVHIGYLIGFRNRLSVMLEWALHHMTGARSARIIHGTIDEKLPRRHKQ